MLASRLIVLCGLAAGVRGLEDCLGTHCADIEDSALLQITAQSSIRPETLCTKWITDAARCLNASATAITTQLPDVALWRDADDEGFKGFYVDDGANDMYDEGNAISVARPGHGFGPLLPYTQQCDGSWTHAGQGDLEYFTCRLDINGSANSEENKSTVWFGGFRSHKDKISGLLITGETGADDSGGAKTGRTSHAVDKRHGYYSQTVGTRDDPSVNHLVVVEADDWHNTYPSGSLPDGLNEEVDVYLAGRPVSSLLYVVWGGGQSANIEYSPADFQTVLASIKMNC